MEGAGAVAQQLAPQRRVPPGGKGGLPGDAAVGAPVVVELEEVVQRAEARETRHESRRQKQRRDGGQRHGGQHAAKAAERNFRLAAPGAPAQPRPHSQAEERAGHGEVPVPKAGQQRAAALGVDACAHQVHPARAEEKGDADPRAAAHGAGGEVPVADKDHGRRNNAQRQRLGVDDGHGQRAEDHRHGIEGGAAGAFGMQVGVKDDGQRKGEEAAAEVFLPERGEKLRALDDGGLGIGADEVDVEDVEHIEHDGGRRGHADAEKDEVKVFERCERPRADIPDRREQHEHPPAVIAAKPPDRGQRLQRNTGGDGAGDHERRQREQPAAAVGQPPRRGARADGRAGPQHERKAEQQHKHAAEFDKPQVGKTVDVQRERAAHRHEEGRRHRCGEPGEGLLLTRWIQKRDLLQFMMAPHYFSVRRRLLQPVYRFDTKVLQLRNRQGPRPRRRRPPHGARAAAAAGCPHSSKGCPRSCRARESRN